MKPLIPGQNDLFGSRVAVDGDTIAVAAPLESSDARGVNQDAVNNNALQSGAVYVFVRNGGAWTQQAYLKASNSEQKDQFGRGLALDGDTLVVGAPYEDSAATGPAGDESSNAQEDSGAVYVFVRSGGSWSQQAYLKAFNTTAEDNFGFSVSINGDTLAVGAPGEGSLGTTINGTGQDDGATTAGAAYIFKRTGTSWTQEAYLKASNTERYDTFGYSVSISSNTAVVGAPGEKGGLAGVGPSQGDNSKNHSGAVYVFLRNGNAWQQQVYLKASNPMVDAEFGHAVSVRGEDLAVGAWLESNGATGVDSNQATPQASTWSGSAYVFTRTNNLWTQQVYLKAAMAKATDRFGGALCLGENTLAVGAYLESSSAMNVDGDQANHELDGAGAVFLFGRNGGTWSQAHYFKASNPDVSDQFGTDVALDGTTLVAGAPWEASNSRTSPLDNSVDKAGAVYVFSP